MITLEEIYNMMTEAFINDPIVIAAYGLEEGKSFNEQFSEASIERIQFYNIASTMLLDFQKYQQHQLDVVKQVSERKAHRPSWYAMMAKLFQYGYELDGDNDYYDNSGLTEELINKSKIVKFAAGVNSSNSSILYLKIATGSNDNKRPLSAVELSAFDFYISQIQDAGVRVKVINAPADEIYIEMDVYYNPLILDRNGKRLDGSNDTPVQDAVRNYVHNLRFNGMYTNAHLIDNVQSVQGVEFPELKLAASRYGAYVDFRTIDAKEVAHAGYYRVSDANLKLRFLPYDE